MAQSLVFFGLGNALTGFPCGFPLKPAENTKLRVKIRDSSPVSVQDLRLMVRGLVAGIWTLSLAFTPLACELSRLCLQAFACPGSDRFTFFCSHVSLKDCWVFSHVFLDPEPLAILSMDTRKLIHQLGDGRVPVASCDRRLLFAVLYVIAGFANIAMGGSSKLLELGLTNYFYNIPASWLVFLALRVGSEK